MPGDRPAADFRLNRFCGCWREAPSDALVREMGKGLSPAAGAGGGGLAVDGRATLLSRNNAFARLGRASVLTADGDFEFREWFSSRGSRSAFFPAHFWPDTDAVAKALQAAPGSWVLAAWDEEGNLLLARDRVGLKELYYARAEGGLFFSSNIASFRSIPGWRPRMNRERLSEYMAFRCVAGPETLFEGVHKILPGELLLMRSAAKDAWKGTFWKYHWTVDAALSFRDAAGEVEERLRTATAGILDAFPGSFLMLSGGIDSSALLAVAEKARPGALVPVTLSPDAAGLSEAEDARGVCRHLHCDRQEVVSVSGGDLLKELMVAHQLMEQPVAHVIGIPYMRIYERMAGGYDSMLTGEFADTLFGYDRFARYHVCWEFDNVLTRPLVRCLARAADVGKFKTWADITGPDWKRQACLSKASQSIGQLQGLVRDFDGSFAFRLGLLDEPCPSRLEQVSSYYYRTFVQDARIFEAVAAHFGIETFFVYGHSRLRDFCLRLPPGFKFRSGRGKYILRKAMEPCLPKKIVWGRKRSGEQPLGAWLRGNPGLRRLTAGLARDARVTDWFNADRLFRLVAEHMQGLADHSALLWQILSLEIWHRLMVDAQSPELCRTELEAAGSKALASIDGAAVQSPLAPT